MESREAKDAKDRDAHKEKGQKRISLLLPEEDYNRLIETSEANFSTIIRELIRDALSPHTITLRVSENTKELYNIISANEPDADRAVEPFLKEAMKKLVDQKIQELQKFKKNL